MHSKFFNDIYEFVNGVEQKKSLKVFKFGQPPLVF